MTNLYAPRLRRQSQWFTCGRNFEVPSEDQARIKLPTVNDGKVDAVLTWLQLSFCTDTKGAWRCSSVTVTAIPKGHHQPMGWTWDNLRVALMALPEWVRAVVEVELHNLPRL